MHADFGTYARVTLTSNQSNKAGRRRREGFCALLSSSIKNRLNRSSATCRHDHFLQRSRHSRFHINSVLVKLMPYFVAILCASRAAPTRSRASNSFRVAQMFLHRTIARREISVLVFVQGRASKILSAYSQSLIAHPH